MLDRYAEFLEILDKRLDKYFEEQCEHIKCKPGCSACCEVGEYPFSKLELDYLMSGYAKLPYNIKQKIVEEIKNLKRIKPKMYKCPFLVNKMCSVYQYRGIVCRTHGLAWYDEEADRIRLPYCVNKGLNYNTVFNRETGEVFLEHPITERLRIDSILSSPKAKELNLEYGEIKPLLRWFC